MAEEERTDADGGPAKEKDGLRKAAEWLVGVGYPVDFSWSAPPPPELWEAVIDVVHEDPTGEWHGNELTRQGVREWLEMELPPGVSQVLAAAQDG